MGLHTKKSKMFQTKSMNSMTIVAGHWDASRTAILVVVVSVPKFLTFQFGGGSYGNFCMNLLG
jgi:hypothetical protein